MAKRQRSSGRLSGGEAQRVSLACAFAIQPDLLMLDEPFSALDAPTRLRLLDDFQSLLAATSITTIFITHDLDEALLLGARVAVILDERMRQVGAPQEVFNSPADQEVAAFVGVKTVIPGEVTAVHEGQVTVKAAGIDLQAVGEIAPGRSVLLRLRPEDITLWPHESPVPRSGARNILKEGYIRRITPQEPLARVVVDCGFTLVALVTRASVQEMPLKDEMQITVTFKASAVHLIPR
ncbi:MAG: TOBE domain-containing protein [Anaerolineales bacterium]|nr:TOBE domain-containing protein [Anaerolineales bacterium]